MTTNGQQMAGDYFTTTANVMSEMFSQETEEWDALRANEVAYNEMLQTQLNTLDNTIRQYGTITDAQRNQVRQSEWELVRAQGSRDTRRLAAQRRAARTIGNAGEDVREKAREAMAGEAGDAMGLAELINPDMNSDQMLEVMRNRINENTTMGRFFGDTFIAGEGGGGQATDSVRIFAGMGVLDSLRRTNESSGLLMDDNQMRELAARTVGLEGGHLLSQSIYNSQQGMITSQAMSSIESTENPSEWLKVMEANAPGWGFTPEILATAARMGSHEERRAELQTELDTRLAEQQGQNRGEEIEAAFRERVGPIGSGQKYGSGLIGSMRRRRAGQSRRATTERLRNASQEQRILMGSMGEAREMVLTSGSDAARDGSSWDAARGLEVMARGNGIASNEKLVELAAGMSNGDNEVRNEILRNYMYLRQLSQSGTQLNTPEVQGERIDEALRRATDRLGEEYSQTDAARIEQATTAVAQRNVHGPVTKTGSDGWAEYSLHENGVISYTDPDGRSRRVPRGDPQYSRLLAITNGEDPGLSVVTPDGGVPPEGVAVTGTPEVEVTPEGAVPTTATAIEELNTEGVSAATQQIDRDTGASFSPSPWAWNTRGTESKALRMSQLNAHLSSSWSSDPSARSRVTAEILGELPEGSKLYWPIGNVPGAIPQVMTADAIQRGGLRNAGGKARFVGEEHRGQYSPAERREQLSSLLSTRPNPRDYSSDAEYHTASQQWSNANGAEVEASQASIRESERFGSSQRQLTYEQQIAADLAGQRGERHRQLEVEGLTAFDAQEKILLERANEAANRGGGIPRSTVPIGGGGISGGRSY